MWLTALSRPLPARCFMLFEQGILSDEDTDAAVAWTWLRWGVMGQSLQWHLGGGAGGIKHFMEHLMDPLAGMMKVLGTPNITPELKQKVVDGATREAGNRSVDELAQEENEVIIELLRSRARADWRGIKESRNKRPRNDRQ